LTDLPLTNRSATHPRTTAQALQPRQIALGAKLLTISWLAAGGAFWFWAIAMNGTRKNIAKNDAFNVDHFIGSILHLRRLAAGFEP
jgi:hypothetical protein